MVHVCSVLVDTSDSCFSPLRLLRALTEEITLYVFQMIHIMTS